MSRERARRAVGFEYPDHPPISHMMLHAAQIRNGKAIEEIFAGAHEDVGWDGLPDLESAEIPTFFRKGRNFDEFSILWELREKGVGGIPVEWHLTERWHGRQGEECRVVDRERRWTGPSEKR
jgi:hypothetical protein